MAVYPIFIVLVLAVINWIAADKKWKIVEYVTKPATMLALLVWMGQATGLGGGMLWFTLGAIFCLAGDVFLMIPRDLFIFGLLSFLLGHGFYILGLNDTPPMVNLAGLLLLLILRKPLALLMILVLLVYVIWLYTKLAAGLKAKGKEKLKIPILVYALVISLMVFSALMTFYRVGWPTWPAVLVSLGAILFYASDSMLAWDRFISPLPHARLRVMSTYHLGQIGILVGAMLHFLAK